MKTNGYSGEASLARRRAERASARRRRAAALLALALAGALALGGTVAWLTAATPAVVNTFSPANVETEIDEDLDGGVKKDVKIANTGDVPVYVRAKVVVNWVDAKGNVVAEVPEGYEYVFMNASGAGVSGLDAQVGEGWLEGDDGFWYYASKLAPKDEQGSSTSNLINSVEVKYPQGVAAAGAEYTLSVEILSEAIQALPDDAFNESWRASSGLTAGSGVLSKTAGPSQGE